MFRETPYVATLLREFAERELLPETAGDERYPSVDSRSETLHAVFFLLQEVGNAPVRFRFKGAFAPYSSDLEAVLEEYDRSRDFWGSHADKGALSAQAIEAIDRLKAVARDVPSAFIHSPPDYDRWWFALASYLFIVRSPLYATGGRRAPLENIARYWPNGFNEQELEAVVERSEALSAGV